MKYVVIAICVLLIIIALLILVRFIRDSFKGKCCNHCSGCSQNHCCPNSKPNKKNRD